MYFEVGMLKELAADAALVTINVMRFCASTALLPSVLPLVSSIGTPRYIALSNTLFALRHADGIAVVSYIFFISASTSLICVLKLGMSLPCFISSDAHCTIPFHVSFS